MSNGLPQIYWYVFWFVLLLVPGIGHIYSETIRHRRNIKALDILKIYAEKGTEPPAAITDQLAKQILDSDKGQSGSSKNTAPQERRRVLVQSFVGFVFAACVAWGLNQWLINAEAAKWAIIASQAAFAFFGFGATGFLLVALVTRDK